MAVTYRSSGTIVANGGAGVDMSSALPSGLMIDDFIVFQGLDADNEHFDLAMPDGWSSEFSDNASNNAGGTFAWKRYDGTERDWQFDTPSGAGSLVMGVLHAYQGTIKTGTPFINLSTQTVANRTSHSAGSGTNDATTLAVSFISIEDNVAVTKVDTSGTWTERDNQTTTVGADGRLICSTSVTNGTVEQTYTTGTSEYSLSLLLKLIPETDRPTIVPNTADAHDFGADDTPTLEFTGSDANDDDLEYEFEILSAIDTDVDKYVESNQDAEETFVTHYWAQSFTGNGDYLTKATLYIRKDGSPTGIVIAKLYAHSGTFGTSSIPTGSALAVSQNINVSAIGGSFALHDFIFDGTFQMVNTTKYVIVIEGNGSVISNTVIIGSDDSSSTHSGNLSNKQAGGSWVARSRDLIFYIEGSIRELNKLSSVPDDIFTNTINGGDTQPFNEGDKADYTVQSKYISDLYSESNWNQAIGFSDVGIIGAGQSFIGDGSKINFAKFYLSTSSSPSGNAVAKLYAHSGTFGINSIPTGSALATSDSFDLSTLTGTKTLIEFTFSTEYQTVDGTEYVIAIDHQGTENFSLWRDSTAPTHEGNSSTFGGTTWSSNSADIVFYVYGNDSLADGTYYWRVRAKDPTGTNQWSDWTTIRSFDIGSGTLSLSGTINTSSNVSGGIIITATLDGTINTSSTVTGNARVTRQLSGTINTSSSVTGELTYKPLQLTGSISTSSSVTGNANVKMSLSGTISCSSSVSADATVLRSLSGSISTSSTVSADAIITAPLQGTINTSSSVSADAVITSQLSGLINTSSSVSGDLTFVTGTKQLSGTINCSSTISGDAVIKAQLSGTIDTSSTVTGNLTFAGTTLQLSGLISCSSSVSANANIKSTLIGTINTSSLVSGEATIKSTLSGVINNLSTVTANLTYQIKQLSGTIETLSTVSANASLKKTISGLISTSSTLSGDIVKISSLSGLINISSSVTGDLSLITSSEDNEIDSRLSAVTILQSNNSLILLANSKNSTATIQDNKLSGVILK